MSGTFIQVKARNHMGKCIQFKRLVLLCWCSGCECCLEFAFIKMSVLLCFRKDHELDKDFKVGEVIRLCCLYYDADSVQP